MRDRRWLWLVGIAPFVLAGLGCFIWAWVANATAPRLLHTCVVRSAGESWCTLANVGRGSGAECWRLVLACGARRASSEVVCSGDVPAMSTKRVSLRVQVDGADPETCSYDFEHVSGTTSTPDP